MIFIRIGGRLVRTSSLRRHGRDSRTTHEEDEPVAIGPDEDDDAAAELCLEDEGEVLATEATGH